MLLNNRTDNILDEFSTLVYEDPDSEGTLIISDDGVLALEKWRDELVTEASRVHKIIAKQKSQVKEVKAVYVGGDCAS
jgi:NADH dehydrogenase FAD-containing subunit